MVTKDDYPFYWQVLPGNTQDITTVENLVTGIKKRFGIKSCTLVFDRGMVSKNNLALIREKNLWYISALDKDEIKSSGLLDLAMPEPASPDDWDQVLAMREFQSFDDGGLLYYREFRQEEYRYILFFDVTRFLAAFKARNRRLQEAYDWIEAKNEELAKAKKSRNASVLERQIKRLLAKKQLKKLVEVEIDSYTITATNKKGKERNISTFRLKATLKPEAKQQEQRLDGLTCFITNLSHQNCPTKEAFHEIKSHISLRPIHLTRTQRVQAHVTICILAYFLINDIEQRLKSNEANISTACAIKELKKCQVSRIEIKGREMVDLKVTEPTDAQVQLLQALECENIVTKKFIKKVLKKAEKLV